MLPAISGTAAPARRPLSVCGGGFLGGGERAADKRLLFCKQPPDLLRLALAPFHSRLLCALPPPPSLTKSSDLGVTDLPPGGLWRLGEGLMALLHAARCRGWSLWRCQSRKCVCAFTPKLLFEKRQINDKNDNQLFKDTNQIKEPFYSHL